MTSVSIIIPCFNQSLYLFDAIESVFIQHLEDFEIIVIDDGSTDVNPSFYEDLKNNKFLSLYKQDNQGAAAARNLGVSKATKEYLAFLDADDVWLTNKIKWQIDALQQNKGDMIFTHIEQFISPDVMTEALATHPIKNRVMAGICPSTLLMKRALFLKVGFFNSQLKLGEFIAWYLKTKMHHLTPYTLEQILVRRRIHKNNTSYRNQAHRDDYLTVMHQHLQEETV